MKLSKKNKPFLLSMIIFILCLTLSPQAFILNSKIYSDGNVSDALANGREALYYIEYSPISGSLLEDDILINLVFIRSFDRGIWSTFRFINSRFDVLLYIISSGLLAYAFFYALKKSMKQISVLALSIGGHAPPLTV
jgi:hypothetical protein